MQSYSSTQCDARGRAWSDGKGLPCRVSEKSNVASDLPEGMLTSIWWRKKGVKYTNNEIYLDIVEEIDCR